MRKRHLITTGCRIFGLLSVVFAVIAACSGRPTNTVIKGVAEPEKRKIRMPEIPDILTAPADRANYLVKHYWDNMDFMDTVYTRLPEVTAQAFADFALILPIAAKSTAFDAINAILKKTEAEPTGRMREYFLKLFDDYIRDPQSPVRNEEFYIPIAEYLIAHPKTDEATRERSKYRLKLLLKNRLGEPASDFSYILRNGQKTTLYNAKAPYTLMMFYNPDCHTCAEVIEKIKHSQLIGTLQQQNRLKIVSVYPDEDLEIWKRHAADVPTTWLDGYDKGAVIQKTELYDLKAIPTLYLLDEQKRILIKDADFEVVEQRLAMLNQ
ncbi:MAG: DUF5106 domain-containing protein [Bacteroidales bacterium]|jgi:hypothetical protein|nr:DUF5106 domain-containing protein [Bacteroidales bacterium]